MILRLFVLGLVASAATAAWCQERNPTTLYVLDVDSGELRRLDDATLPGMTFMGSPQWSPDGERIVFDATPRWGEWLKSKIAVYHLVGDRQGETDDLGYGNAPCWSPVGDQIGFFMNGGSYSGAEGGLWVMDANGGGRERLGGASYPLWSPDGDKLVVSGGGGWSIFSLSRGNYYGSRPYVDSVWKPSWSPTGDRLAVLAEGMAGIAAELVDVTEDYVTRERLWTTADDPERWRDEKPHQITWSPKGDRLLILASEADGGPNRYYRLKTEPGAKPEPIGIETPGGFDASWAPDGKRIVFASSPF